MLKIDLQVSGTDILEWARNLKQNVKRGTEAGITDALKHWQEVVLASTWYHPRPSPVGDIIMRWQAKGDGYEVEYGWRHYSGDQGKAATRAEMRRVLAEEPMLRLIEGGLMGALL